MRWICTSPVALIVIWRLQLNHSSVAISICVRLTSLANKVDDLLDVRRDQHGVVPPIFKSAYIIPLLIKGRLWFISGNYSTSLLDVVEDAPRLESAYRAHHRRRRQFWKSVGQNPTGQNPVLVLNGEPHLSEYKTKPPYRSKPPPFKPPPVKTPWT